MAIFDRIKQLFVSGSGGVSADSSSQTRAQFDSVNSPSFAQLVLGNVVTANFPTGSCLRTFREMRKIPTVALARAVGNAPILSAKWAIEAREDADESMVKYLEEFVESVRRKFLRDVIYIKDYGFKPFELVWNIEDAQQFGRTGPVLTVERIKPLNVEQTFPIVDKKQTDLMLGVKNFGVELSREFVAWFTYDSEDDSFFGRPIWENVRETAYKGWVETFNRQLKYLQRVASPIPMITYPPGSARDVNGTERSTFRIAEALMKMLIKGDGILMPNTLAVAAQQLLDRGVDISKVTSWTISFLEASGQATGGFNDTLRKYESDIMRGALVPERTATEGQMGTKAEAGVHGDIAITIAEETNEDIVAQFNCEIINPILEANLGPESKDSIYVTSQPLVDEQKAMVRGIVTAALAKDSNLIDQWLDIDALLDMTGLPKAEEIILPDPENPATPEPDPSEEDPEGQSANEIMASLTRLISRNGHRSRNTRARGRVLR